MWVPTYELNPRQCRSFQHLVDVYVPIDPENISSDREADVTYPLSPNYPAVPCYFQPEGDIEEPGPEGRNKPGNIFTLGKFHFHSTQDIDDTYALQFKTLGHPLFGIWFIVQGFPTILAGTRTRSTNTSVVFAKRGPNPLPSS